MVKYIFKVNKKKLDINVRGPCSYLFVFDFEYAFVQLTILTTLNIYMPAEILKSLSIEQISSY